MCKLDGMATLKNECADGKYYVILFTTVHALSCMAFPENHSTNHDTGKGAKKTAVVSDDASSLVYICSIISLQNCNSY